VFGPTAAGSPAANPPVIIGGTSDGTATGNVTNWKVVSGIGYLNLAQVNAVTVLTGAGATGTGSQRVTVAQDATTVAGLPPGQALAAASAPVVLTAAQLLTLTPPTTVTANQGTANATPWNENVSQWAAVTLGAATAWGSAPTGNVPGVNANILGPLGQQLAAASLPVVLPAAQIAALTPPTTVIANQGGAPWGVTLPTTPTIAAGSGEVPAPSSESAAGLTPVPSTALEANHIIKAGAGNLYSFNVSADSTLSGAAWWLMIYNATSAPADGAVTPAKCYAFPSGTTGYSAAFNLPVNFSTGITIGVSTTGCFTKTASAHAFFSGDAK